MAHFLLVKFLSRSPTSRLSGALMSPFKVLVLTLALTVCSLSVFGQEQSIIELTNTDILTMNTTEVPSLPRSTEHQYKSPTILVLNFTFVVRFFDRQV